jgi:sulfatase modifying factor 1
MKRSVAVAVAVTVAALGGVVLVGACTFEDAKDRPGGDGGGSDGGSGAPDGSGPNTDGSTDNDSSTRVDGGKGDGGLLGDAGLHPDGSTSAEAGPSCAPGGAGMTDCGGGAESCCTTLLVTGGTFSRTYTNDGSGALGQTDSATVDSFMLDKYEVTVGRFRQFVLAWRAGWSPAVGSGLHTHLNGGLGLGKSGAPGSYEPGWIVADNAAVSVSNGALVSESPLSSWTELSGPNEKKPISTVNWQESYAFCIWDGAFLPSAAEWEYAAAGGSEQRQYPWGSTAPGVASQYAIFGCLYPSGSGTCVDTGSVASVGSATAGAGKWGQLDLVGSMLEWNRDSNAAYDVPCTNCSNTITPEYRMRAGGAFNLPNANNYLFPGGRFWGDASTRAAGIGLRCARSP